MRILALVLALGVVGCGSSGREDSPTTPGAEMAFKDAEARIVESRTLSGLAKLEEAIAAYTKTEGHIPRKLTDLIPGYLADMPAVELAIRGHRDNTSVQAYPSDVLRDGRVDGMKLRDTGRWGYVFNDRQVVVFVDCTHKSSRGIPWYQERGVY